MTEPLSQNAAGPTDESPAPLVSILIPCWGCERYIAATIESALRQTYAPIEVIVVEDAGADGTYEEACRIVDPRLRVYRNAVNLGQFRNKNECARKAAGGLLKYLDGDDLLEPDCVARLVRAWRGAGPGVVAVFGNYDVIDADGRFVNRPRRWGVSGRVRGPDVFRAMLARREAGSHFGNPSPHLIDRAALERVGAFPADHSWAGDWELFLKLLCAGDVVFVEAVVAHYRVQLGSISHNTSVATSIRDNIGTVERLARWLRALPDPPEAVRDERVVREWMVWQSGDRVLAHWLRWLRRRPNAWREVVETFEAAGLGPELRRFVRTTAVRHVGQTLRQKARERLGVERFPALFDPRQLKPSSPA